ncbi:uncharacterized protein LOC141696492 [Apium graveolens]|uniref:uncharacterized protein LOC141696492 n=1 Tax=Apium graveolens TaxID=4045 RepID=UPI003D7B2303
MDADYFISLFDSCWFGHKSFIKHSTISNIPEESLSIHHMIQEDSTEPMLLKQPSILIRSKSDQLNNMTSYSSDHCSSPNSVLLAPHLQTILSGKEVNDEALQEKQLNLTDNGVHAKLSKNVRRKMRSTSKSLSDLEFEELKGFMDLGFIFSEEDKDSSLADIIPGLHRLGEKNNGQNDDHEVTRPYLSEAWEVMEEEKIIDALNNWRVPAPENEIDMKDSLKWWAHTVASAVK